MFSSPFLNNFLLPSALHANPFCRGRALGAPSKLPGEPALQYLRQDRLAGIHGGCSASQIPVLLEYLVTQPGRVFSRTTIGGYVLVRAALLPIVRTDQSRPRHPDGAGLGRAIVKSIGWAHSGKVEVESVVGHGSCFRVKLPLAKEKPNSNIE
jgi:light-regulated signal transduction histidine kinase (bacteriophytochrome)